MERHSPAQRIKPGTVPRPGQVEQKIALSFQFTRKTWDLNYHRSGLNVNNILIVGFQRLVAAIQFFELKFNFFWSCQARGALEQGPAKNSDPQCSIVVRSAPVAKPQTHKDPHLNLLLIRPVLVRDFIKRDSIFTVSLSPVCNKELQSRRISNCCGE